MTLTTSVNPFQPSIDRFNSLDAKGRCNLMPGILEVMDYIHTKRSSDEIMEKIKSTFPKDTDPLFALDLVSLAVRGHDFSKS